MNLGTTQLGIFLLALVIFYSNPTEACSCMPAHPQTHFCGADYVVIIRVLRKSPTLVAEKVAYKVEIKKSYKMNSEAHKMLQHGRILTAAGDSMCGVNLKLGRLYLIAGRTPRLSACSYVKEYMKMSIIERRGFSGVYRKGCNCRIKSCFNNQCYNSQSATACHWSPFNKCETEFTGCMPSILPTPEGVIHKCLWRETPAYKDCLSNP